MTPLAQRALEIIIGQIGQEEKPRGSNWGRPVQDYLDSVGIHFPASWCMALVYYCYNSASKQLGIDNPLYKTGGVLMQLNKSSAKRFDDPLPGDIFIMDHGHGLGHTGIVRAINPDGTLITVEGNTNDTGSREGYEVCERHRKNAPPIVAYLRC